MGVDQRDIIRADDLAHDIGEAEEGSVARIMAAVRATGPLTSPTRHPMSPSIGNAAREDGHDPGTCTPEPSSCSVEDEIVFHRQLAESGHAQAARRVAELLELIHNDKEARRWWHRAAQLGDEDAVAYVRHILT